MGSALVVGIDFKIYGGTALLGGMVTNRREQRPADAFLALLRDHVQLLQPGRLAPCSKAQVKER
jgi:hypothetical protein